MNFPTMDYLPSDKSVKIFLIGLIVFGIACRFWGVANDNLVYYDEGLYLAHNIDFQDFVKKNPPASFPVLWKYLSICFHLAIADTKSLWFFLCSLRSLIWGPEAIFFPKLLSAIFGSLTVVLTFIFAKQYCRSEGIALLSAAILATLPSHVYYSRLAMQEGLSTFLFLAGLYYYVFSPKLIRRYVVAGLLFAGVFFTNYRLIVIPGLLAFIELFYWATKSWEANFKRWFYTALTFFAGVFILGNIDNGANTRVAFGWMFYQMHLAQGTREFLNFFSYPYYLFSLESIMLALSFFASFYFVLPIARRRYADQTHWALLVALVFFYMVLFSLSQEKGVRYLCILLPLIATGASTVWMMFKEFLCLKNKKTGVLLWIGIISIMFFIHVIKIITIVNFKTDYRASIETIVQENGTVGILSTQPLVQKLFVSHRNSVLAAPPDWPLLIALYQRGYRYLIVDPQVYISYTQDTKRFSLPLKGYLSFITQAVKPYKEYPHFSKELLRRFVLEHNENLRVSLDFLKNSTDKDWGTLKVYDIRDCFVAMQKFKQLSVSQQKLDATGSTFRQ